MSWDSFAEALADVLPSLPAGAIVVITEPGEGGRFTQFIQYPDRLIAEVAGNSFLKAEWRASAAGEAVIAGAGWRPFELTVTDEIWRVELAWPAPVRRYLDLAAMVVTALRDGYGIAGPEGFRYRAWNERQGNDPVDLPGLGLPRRP